MSNAKFTLPQPVNEPIKTYLPGSPEKLELKAKLKELASQEIEIPLIIGGKEIRTGNTGKIVVPHDHKHVLATFHKAGDKEIQMAIDASQEARKTWANMPWQDRAAIFKKMAALLAGPWRATLNASTMLNQSKNVYQAEIDAACELIDFFNFNVKYMEEIYEQQPYSPDGYWNRLEQRALEGFIFAVTPFNFTSIAGNLPTAPAMMGNVVLWKPASSTVYSGYYLMKLFQAAGLPDGVINFIPGSGAKVGPKVLESPLFSGVHFTGSTGVFQGMWETIGKNIANYKTYPRIVGETGGKDFVFVHNTAKAQEVATGIVRGAFEYQGQKCSAASRAYVPASMWPELSQKLKDIVGTITLGDPAEDFTHFMNAVIDRPAFNTITSYIDYAKESNEAEFLTGGTYDDSKGFFIDPTIIVTKNPHFKTMEEEIFGPVMTIYVYEDEKLEEALELCDTTSPYALTGCVFSSDRHVINYITERLQHAAGNFYINDKPTAAVVGQQPFGGSRASGTNDKAGSMINLLRWVSPRTLKETFVPATDYRYPFQQEK